MKHLFKILNKISEILQVASIWLAVVYVTIWCYRFAGLPYDINHPFMHNLEFLSTIMRDTFHWNIVFLNRSIDMSYLPAVFVLFVLYFIFINTTSFFERAINDCILEELEEKEKEERLLNAELEENLKQDSMENNAFIGLLDLHLEPSLDQNIKSNMVELTSLKNTNNRQILNGIKVPYNTEGRIKNGKLVYLVDNFDMFDDFLVCLLENIKKVYKDNKALNVQTSFTLSFDAIKNTSSSVAALNILEKISSFKYFNKVIITTLFLSRYEYSTSHKFEAKTMGISRFFEKKSINLKGEIQFESEDFDLYSLKLKKTN